MANSDKWVFPLTLLGLSLTVWTSPVTSKAEKWKIDKRINGNQAQFDFGFQDNIKSEQPQVNYFESSESFFDPFDYQYSFGKEPIIKKDIPRAETDKRLIPEQPPFTSAAPPLFYTFDPFYQPIIPGEPPDHNEIHFKFDFPLAKLDKRLYPCDPVYDTELGKFMACLSGTIFFGEKEII